MLPQKRSRASLSSLVYLLSITFPTWGGLVAAAYLLSCGGLRVTSFRNLFNF